MSVLPSLKIKNLVIPHCIIQGGMGAGVSGTRLVREVSYHGGLGTLSSAGMRDLLSLRYARPFTTYEAVRMEIEITMAGGLREAINIMRVLDESYDDTVRAALDAKVSAIIFGAGLPKQVPDSDDTAYILMASSARTLRIMLNRWRRRPDAVIVEGPRAGGHLGFKMEDVENPEFALENLLPEILDLTEKNGNIPVIAAGGIYTHEDIERFLSLGVSGVQMATRFLATWESGATDEFKRQIVAAKEEDIKVIDGSPCGFPFRILTASPMYQTKRPPKCRMGYVLAKDENGHYTVCKAAPNNPHHEDYFCICDGLRAAIGKAPNEPAMYTVGANAYRVDRTRSVAELMKELVGS